MNQIGGYLGLEINERFDNVGKYIALNSGRNALRYIIRAYKIKEIYLPHYTCPVVRESAEAEKCKANLYHIDENFMPLDKFKSDDFILYTNYFGICAKNVKTLAKMYKNLIIDNAQAFYMPSYGIASFNSIRKFFGVPDGALLYSDKILKCDLEQDTSYQRCAHLLKRLDVDATFGYDDFRKNDKNLSAQSIKKMSNLTRILFNSIDIVQTKAKRMRNFTFLHEHLNQTNQLNLALDDEDVPMVYPYLVDNGAKLKAKLIKNNIFVATYWNAKNLNGFEKDFQNDMIPLPIDQRYNLKDMNQIIKRIQKELK